jgi:hypothetical protein
MADDCDIIVRLRIFSDCMSPAEIGDRVGVMADREVPAEFRIGSISKPRHEWQLDSGLPTGSLEAKLAALLDRLHNHESRVAALSDACEIVVSCVIYAAEIPALYFDSDIMSRIAGLCAALDVDLYLPVARQPEGIDS